MESEFEARIHLAKKLNKLISLMFENIGDEAFNLSLELFDIPSSTLENFWLYTTGFLSLQNYENDDYLISETDSKNLVDGKFYLKELSAYEVSKMLKDANIPERRSGYSQVYDLYSVQDGKYSIEKNSSYSRRSANYLVLSTSPLKVESQNPYFKNNAAQKLRLLRNSLAHSVPYINGTTLTLLASDYKIVFSKMWLRGFAETFAKLNMKIDEKDIHKKLLNGLSSSHNYIENERDIDGALSQIKNYFDDETIKNFHRITTFVKSRIRYEPNFFKKSFDEKVSSIASICANNKILLNSSNGTINPAIVYNLQQLVAKELLSRGEEAYLSEQDLELEKLNELNKKKIELEERSNRFLNNNQVIKTKFQRIQQQAIQKELCTLYNKYDEFRNQIETKRKLECSNMELGNLESLQHLPVEVAVNLVWLSAFNNLCISGFYDNLLSLTDCTNLTEEQTDFFSKFNMSKLNVTYYQQKTDSLTPQEKAYVLSVMRNSLCHGLVSYNFPSVKQSATPTFNDVNMTFFNEGGTSISGKLIDFFKFFNQINFTMTRKNKFQNINQKPESRHQPGDDDE